MRRTTAMMVGALASALTFFACTDREPAAPGSPSFARAGRSSGSGSQTTFSGDARVVRAVVPLLGVDLTLVEAGPLRPEGGADEATLLEAEVPGLLTARVLHAATVGQGDASRSEASVANLSLTVGGNTISADFLMARAEARCERGKPRVSGSSEIANLVINGEAVTVRGSPNQAVTLPGGGQVIINEQTATSNDITVNAVHVMIPGVADVIISSAHADITCGRECPPPQGDFVTGGGWIRVSGAKATFGVAGGIKAQGLWGHLTYIDHGTRLKVKGSGVTGYDVLDATTRRITGTADIDGRPGTYEVIVSDGGEPGRNDTFQIRLSTGYSASGKLDGGNIQLHAKPSDCL